MLIVGKDAHFYGVLCFTVSTVQIQDLLFPVIIKVSNFFFRSLCVKDCSNDLWFVETNMHSGQCPFVGQTHYEVAGHLNGKALSREISFGPRVHYLLYSLLLLSLCVWITDGSMHACVSHTTEARFSFLFMMVYRTVTRAYVYTMHILYEALTVLLSKPFGKDNQVKQMPWTNPYFPQGLCRRRSKWSDD